MKTRLGLLAYGGRQRKRLGIEPSLVWRLT